ncbi:WD domain-containing protein [Fusarium globosum]|uniref:WD domain-containing protein n=1 Tax=Fusarium globosum TaxID=78864 RepID=A0A8H5XFJ2_9HYPO|nr:WD domain-containing protein [Fusarium globosum]
MPSSPHTPRHSRNSSAFDSFAGSPQARRLSKSSVQEPSTPFRNSFNHQDASDLGGNGMGNLADELADAFSDSGDEGEYTDGDANSDMCEAEGGGQGNDQMDEIEYTEDTNSPKTQGCDRAKAMNLTLLSPRRKHQRQTSNYDGSEYGSESDLDSPGMPPGLVSKMDAVESLARRGTENYGGPADDVFRRVTNALRDLGSQSSVEASASRLITAHSALTTHLNHQSRQIHNLSFSLLSPLVAPPDPETIDDLIPLLLNLSDAMPRPSTSAFNSLTSLHTLTTELVQNLNYLSDTLHMSRQTTTMATRRLKSAKEIVAEMRREEELREEGERWLTRGNWGERLEKRECAGVCGDVIGGFEEVCNGWRERLLAQAEAQA